MGEVQKASDFECYTPSLDLFRIQLIVELLNYRSTALQNIYHERRGFEVRTNICVYSESPTCARSVSESVFAYRDDFSRHLSCKGLLRPVHGA
jgi:hypothetical protein